MLSKFESGTSCVTVTPETVTIEHKAGTPNSGMMKTIRMSSVTAIEFRRAGRLFAGSMQLIFSGSGDRKGRKKMAAARDENTVMFRRKDEESFLACKALIEQYIFERGM